MLKCQLAIDPEMIEIRLRKVKVVKLIMDLFYGQQHEFHWNFYGQQHEFLLIRFICQMMVLCHISSLYFFYFGAFFCLRPYFIFLSGKELLWLTELNELLPLLFPF